MKIAIAQQSYLVDSLGKNATKIAKAIFEARSKKADLVVFPEMSICGYSPCESLLREDYMEPMMQVLQRIATEAYEITVLIGCPTYCEDENETKVYDSAILIENGTITRRFNKKGLSNEESAYCITDKEPNILDWNKKKFAICVGNDMPEDTNADIVINISADNNTDKSKQFADCQNTVICVRQCGNGFSGASFIKNEGKILIELSIDNDELVVFDTESFSLI
ncbi:MAG: hypothetical protein MJ204_06310 [Bacteroidales bacterium]|nr:hypothetical protein [Bacteroidales bacterium]